jgi:hypothetical protein
MISVAKQKRPLFVIMCSTHEINDEMFTLFKQQ